MVYQATFNFMTLEEKEAFEELMKGAPVIKDAEHEVMTTPDYPEPIVAEKKPKKTKKKEAK